MPETFILGEGRESKESIVEAKLFAPAKPEPIRPSRRDFGEAEQYHCGLERPPTEPAWRLANLWS